MRWIIVLFALATACSESAAPVAPPRPPPATVAPAALAAVLESSPEHCFLDGYSLEFEVELTRVIGAEHPNWPHLAWRTADAVLRPVGVEYIYVARLESAVDDNVQIYATGHIDPGNCDAEVITWRLY